MQKNVKVSVGFIHILTLTEKKGSQTTSSWSTFKKKKLWPQKSFLKVTWRQRDLTQGVLSQTCIKLPMGCHEQPELAQFTHLWLGISAITDCSSTARAGSSKGWVMCLPYVSHYGQMWLFRKEIPSWKSKAKLSGAQILYDLHKNYKWKNKNWTLKWHEYQLPANLWMYSNLLLHIL